MSGSIGRAGLGGRALPDSAAAAAAARRAERLVVEKHAIGKPASRASHFMRV